MGSDGKTRPLHIKQALDVTKLVRPEKYVSRDGYLLSCDYFVVSHEVITSGASYKGDADERSFGSIVILEGCADVICQG
ncbi:hypothetical protein [Butyrivibrio sp. YAB3001]|uniref:hypothetical protein n=1 Tax=Butyrivibrio sp. YAB3001 TaxID=1520812 RepID=UPI000B84F601|nr:hypothetical protein [Butyrivibrio sp. YAB3001]